MIRIFVTGFNRLNLVTKRLSALLSAFKDTKVKAEVEKIDKEVFEIMAAAK